MGSQVPSYQIHPETHLNWNRKGPSPGRFPQSCGIVQNVLVGKRIQIQPEIELKKIETLVCIIPILHRVKLTKKAIFFQPGLELDFFFPYLFKDESHFNIYAWMAHWCGE